MSGGFIAKIVDWTTATFAPLGVAGLFLLAFIESSFFPVPPDVLLIILALEQPHLWVWFAAVCTVGSTLGGLLGYGIGYVGEEVVLKRMFSEKKIKKVHDLFSKYDAWAIFIAGLTPIPYKVFTIAAGVFYINIPRFVIASILGRGLRFFLVAFLIGTYGHTMKEFIDQYFDIISLVGGALLVFGYVCYRYFVKLPKVNSPSNSSTSSVKSTPPKRKSRRRPSRKST